jgi:hypothetical protein
MEDQKTQKPGTKIPEAFRRILQFVRNDEGTVTNPTNKPNEMILKVTTRPNPFFASVTLDIMCDQNKHVIVRMFDEAGKIIRMISWYVMKGSNVTSINELNTLNNGQYFLDIIDSEGSILFNTMLTKQ